VQAALKMEIAFVMSGWANRIGRCNVFVNSVLIGLMYDGIGEEQLPGLPGNPIIATKMSVKGDPS
jgi:hypothetical protein